VLSWFLIPAFGVALSLPLQAQDVDEMIIPGQAASQPPGTITDTSNKPLPYPDVYLPPATTVWLNGTLGAGSTESLDYYYNYYDRDHDVSHLHYTVSVALQFRLVGILSMSVNLGQASTRTKFGIDTTNMTFEEYRQRYNSSDRNDYEDGIARRSDNAVMTGLALHVVTSETDLFAAEVGAGFDVRFQDFEDGFDFTLMLAARYQPASALRIRLGGMYLHERLSAVLSIGVAP